MTWIQRGFNVIVPAGLLIQISRTSSIIDIVVLSKMAAGGYFVKTIKKKLLINLKWPEMRSKVIFGHTKWPPAAILSKHLKTNQDPYGSEMARNAIESEFRTSKMADRSEMARNAIESDFRTSKMAAEKNNFCIDLKWPELLSKVNFRHPKWPIDLNL